MAEENQKSGDGLKGGAQTPPDRDQRKRRNLAIALSLAAFIALIYIVTILRMGGS